MENSKKYRYCRAIFPALLFLLNPVKVSAVDGRVVWDNKCEECHGDPIRFSEKYLWNIEGQLQGQHHIEDLDLYMRQHYIPDYAFGSIRNLLLKSANSPARFNIDCSRCHGTVAAFVRKSIWVRGNEVTGLESGRDIREFLPAHQNLQTRDVSFYLKLFARTAGKPFYDEEPLLEAITR